VSPLALEVRASLYLLGCRRVRVVQTGGQVLASARRHGVIITSSGADVRQALDRLATRAMARRIGEQVIRDGVQA
jgi:hypothetical protein